MHPTILVQRQAKAIERIIARATALAAVIDLDPALISALKPQGPKDLRVIEMMRMEALANLFDQLAVAAGIEDAVTAVTPVDDEAAPGPDGLPAPTLEEVTGDQPPTLVDQFTDEYAESPAAEPEAETPAEVESADATVEEIEPATAEEPAPEVIEEIAPAEEEPTPAKPKRKSRSKK